MTMNITFYINSTEAHFINLMVRGLMETVFFSIFAIVSILIAAGGNFLIILAVLSNRNLLCLEHNLYLVSLALGDFIVGVFVMPIGLVEDILGYWSLGSNICLVWIFLDNFCATGSILNICVIKYDTYRRISCAKYYNDWINSTKVIGHIFAFYIVAFLMAAVPILLRSERSYQSFQGGLSNAQLCAFDAKFKLTVTSAVVTFYIPTLIMLALDWKLFSFSRHHVIVLKYSYTSQPVLDADQLQRSYSIWYAPSSNYKSLYMIFILGGAFLVCWTPYFVVQPISAYDPLLVNRYVFDAAIWLGYWSSCANAIILITFNREFRETLIQIMCCRTTCCRSEMPEKPKHQSFDLANYIRVIKAKKIEDNEIGSFEIQERRIVSVAIDKKRSAFNDNLESCL